MNIPSQTCLKTARTCLEATKKGSIMSQSISFSNFYYTVKNAYLHKITVFTWLFLLKDEELGNTNINLSIFFKIKIPSLFLVGLLFPI